MTDRIDATTSADLNGFADIMERIGIAIMGALCGLFVAAMVAKADIEEINSLGALFSTMLYGSVGFYLRTNIPSLSSSGTFSTSGSGPKANPVVLASAIGTLVAAVAALVSVYMIIFDETTPWNVGIGLGWAFGVLLQLAAGTTARLGQYGGATVKASGRPQAGKGCQLDMPANPVSPSRSQYEAARIPEARKQTQSRSVR